MLASILHRVTGDGMATVGTILFVWWLAALAAGDKAYAVFVSFSLFQHMMSGIRHLVLDTGAAFELKTNRLLAILTFVASTLLTIAFWLVLVGII